MQSAAEPLRDVLRQVEVSQTHCTLSKFRKYLLSKALHLNFLKQVRRPEINVYSNVDGKRYMSESHIRRQLVKQLTSPVKWEQTLHEMYERTQGRRFPHTYEVGPGKQLGATLQKCNRKAFANYVHVKVTTYED